MKTKLFTLALAALTIGLLGSCKKEDPKVSVTGVTLDKTTLEITVGDPDVKLTATVAPENATDKTFSWSSDKTDVATVDNQGNVHAVAPGIATITVTTTDGGNTATCTVTVKAAKVSVTGVTLDKTTLEITVGDPDVKLTATVLPENATDKTVNWSSDKTEFAIVDNQGSVHAVAPGTATITVATTDGGITATCAVTVKAAVVPVSGVALDKTTLEITVGDPDVKLTAAVAPENATDKTVSWASDKTEVATVDNQGNVHAVAPGTATITVTTTDGNKTATCAVTVNAAPNEVVGEGLFTYNGWFTGTETLTLEYNPNDDSFVLVDPFYYGTDLVFSVDENKKIWTVPFDINQTAYPGYSVVLYDGKDALTESGYQRYFGDEYSHIGEDGVYTFCNVYIIFDSTGSMYNFMAGVETFNPNVPNATKAVPANRSSFSFKNMQKVSKEDLKVINFSISEK